MDERMLALGLAVLLMLGVWGATHGYRWWLMWRRRTQPAELDDALHGLAVPRDGRPVILGFTGEFCAPCKTHQRPALAHLRQQFHAALHIHELDALAHADLAQRYGVLTVPTTVVLDGTRQVVAINYGVASAAKLQKQVQPYMRA